MAVVTRDPEAAEDGRGWGEALGPAPASPQAGVPVDWLLPAGGASANPWHLGEGPAKCQVARRLNLLALSWWLRRDRLRGRLNQLTTQPSRERNSHRFALA